MGYNIDCVSTHVPDRSNRQRQPMSVILSLEWIRSGDSCSGYGRRGPLFLYKVKGEYYNYSKTFQMYQSHLLYLPTPGCYTCEMDRLWINPYCIKHQTISHLLMMSLNINQYWCVFRSLKIVRHTLLWIHMWRQKSILFDLFLWTNRGSGIFITSSGLTCSL